MALAAPVAMSTAATGTLLLLFFFSRLSHYMYRLWAFLVHSKLGVRSSSTMSAHARTADPLGVALLSFIRICFSVQ